MLGSLGATFSSLSDQPSVHSLPPRSRAQLSCREATGMLPRSPTIAVMVAKRATGRLKPVNSPWFGLYYRPGGATVIRHPF